MKLHSEIENKKIKAERPKDRLANLVRSFESEQGICICKNRAKLNVSDPSENLDYRDTEVVAFEQVPAGEPVHMLGGRVLQNTPPSQILSPVEGFLYLSPR